MIRVQYRSYNFNTPSALTELQYRFYKNKLLKSPKKSIKEKNNFFYEFLGELLFLGGGVLFILLSLILGEIQIINIIGFLLCITSLIRLLLQLPSYIKYIFMKNKYFSMLRKYILKSNNFDEFKKYEKYEIFMYF
jgi:hypothetical protein